VGKFAASIKRPRAKSVQGAGMWSRSRLLSFETVSRRTNVSSRSRLGQNPQHLGLVSVSDRCVSGFISVSEQYVLAQ